MNVKTDFAFTFKLLSACNCSVSVILLIFLLLTLFNALTVIMMSSRVYAVMLLVQGKVPEGRDVDQSRVTFILIKPSRK